MESNKKSYYAIIPANVRYDESLPPNAKLLYGEITALCNAEGYCWASNKYFAELYGVTTTTISLLIKSLIERGYIQSEIVYKEGTKEILNRYLTILNYPIKEILNTPIKEKLKDNNTSSFNTTSNNTNEYINNSDKPTRKRFVAPTVEEVRAYCTERNNNVDAQQFWDYYDAGNWCDSKGVKMKSWKQKVITWEKHSTNAKTPKRSVGEEAYEFYEIGKQMQEEGEPF